MRAILESQLLVSPDRFLDLVTGNANASTTTKFDPLGSTFDVQGIEDVVNSADEVFELFNSVTGSGSDPETFFTDGDGGVVDRLNVDAVVGEQRVGSSFGESSVANQDGDDVRRTWDDGDIHLLEPLLQDPSVQVLQPPILDVLPLISDASLSSGHNAGRQARGEDEAGSVRANQVDEVGLASDVSSNDAKSLAKSTSDNVDAVHDSSFDRFNRIASCSVSLEVEMFGDASTTRSIHADGVDFIEEGDSTVLVGEVADLFDGPNGAAHRVHALESDDLGLVLGVLLQLGLKVLEVVVLEDDLLGAAMANALDHGRMVHVVGEDDAVGQLGSESGESGVVGDVARGKDQCSRLAVQGGEFIFQGEVHRPIAGDVSGPTRSSAVLIQGAARLRADISTWRRSESE